MEDENMTAYERTLLHLTASVQRGQIEEAKSAEGYAELLAEIGEALNNTTDAAERKTLLDAVGVISEIQSDEINHQYRLLALTVILGGIEPAKR